tara:strand:+ start:1421 stop:1909 length:489 start_codon:yes stop_codon:yes gene_type:complete
MDPITVTAAISAASSAVGYLKKAVNAGREMQDCVGQLSKWASAMSDLNHLEQKHKQNNIPWWKKMSGSVEAEALAVFEAKTKADHMREELYSFLSAHWGPSYVKELKKIEGQIRKQRKEQLYKKQEAIEKLITLGATIGCLIVGGLLLGGMIYGVGLYQGRW